MQARAAVMPSGMDAGRSKRPGGRAGTAGGVLVRVVASGICQTDVHARDGFFPIPCPAVCGHEGAGVVEQVGSAV